MFLYTGFNGFGQFNTFCTEISKLKECDVVNGFLQGKLDQGDVKFSLSLSWSSLLVIQGKNAFLTGFVNGKSFQTVTLNTPFNDSIVQGFCGNKECLLITYAGQIWSYYIDTGSWKNLTNFQTTEVPLESENTKIIKFCRGERLALALSNTGVAYCVPNMLIHSHPGKIRDVACGKEHGVLLTKNGTVLTWGGGSRGQLGTGNFNQSEEVCVVEALAGLTVVKISAGGWHTGAITDQGDLYTWGWNKQGQLGLPTIDKECGVSVSPLPKPVDLPDKWFVEDISCGISHTVIKLKCGEVLGCGWNKWGQLGLGSGVKQCDALTQLHIPPGTSVREIVCGPWSTALITSTYHNIL